MSLPTKQLSEHRPFVRALALTLAVLLTACGGGGTDEEEQAKDHRPQCTNWLECK